MKNTKYFVVSIILTLFYSIIINIIDYYVLRVDVLKKGSFIDESIFFIGILMFHNLIFCFLLMVFNKLINKYYILNYINYILLASSYILIIYIDSYYIPYIYSNYPDGFVMLAISYLLDPLRKLDLLGLVIALIIYSVIVSCLVFTFSLPYIIYKIRLRTSPNKA